MFTKADGIYIYDLDTNNFENIWAGLSSNPHPDTGKGTHTWGNDVYVPLGAKGLVRVIGSDPPEIVAVSPLLPGVQDSFETPGNSKIAAMASDDAHLWAIVTAIGQEHTATGIAVLTDVTIVTSQATDSDPTTEFTPLTVLKTIKVSGTVRFGGIHFTILDNSTTGDYTISEVAYWTGSSYTAISTGFQDGTLGFTVSGIVSFDEPVPDGWVLNGGVYTIQITYTVNGTPDHSIQEVRVLTEGTPLEGKNVGASGFDSAGLRTHILKGYPVGRGFHWDDVASLEGAFDRGLLISRVLSPTGGRTLFVFGRDAYQHFPLGFGSSPDDQPYTNVTNGFASLLRLPADDRITSTGRAPTTIKGLAYIDIHGRDWQRDDLIQAWFRFDGGSWQKLGDSRGGRENHNHTRLEIPRDDSARGYEYEVIVGIEDAAVDERVPKITSVVAGVYQLEGPPTKD